MSFRYLLHTSGGTRQHLHKVDLVLGTFHLNTFSSACGDCLQIAQHTSKVVNLDRTSMDELPDLIDQTGFCWKFSDVAR